MAEPFRNDSRGQNPASSLTAGTGQRTEHIIMQNINDVIEVGNKSADKTDGYGHDRKSFDDCRR
jgi:hypothetical protein